MNTVNTLSVSYNIGSVYNCAQSQSGQTRVLDFFTANCINNSHWEISRQIFDGGDAIDVDRIKIIRKCYNSSSEVRDLVQHCILNFVLIHVSSSLLVVIL